MYIPMVVALLLVLPVVSIIVDTSVGVGHPTAEVALRWFVFWAVGVRLLLAGIRQIASPEYTAKVILGLKSDEPLVVVRELGIANSALGCVASISVIAHGWAMPMALAGAVFYGLAAANHVADKTRNQLQSVALISDALISIVLIGCFVLVAIGHP